MPPTLVGRPGLDTLTAYTQLSRAPQKSSQVLREAEVVSDPETDWVQVYAHTLPSNGVRSIRAHEDLEIRWLSDFECG